MSAEQTAGIAEVSSLIRELRAGRIEAYSEIVKLYQKRVIALSLIIVRDFAAAEDLAQDAFVRAYTQLHRYDDKQDFYPWLATITVRLSQNWLRTEKRARARVEVANEDAENISQTDFLGKLIEDESSRQLWLSVAALAPSERTATLLYYQQDMKVADIAKALDVSDGTIKTMLYRSRQKLREALCWSGRNSELAEE
ncbi:MAG: sigma-70 family RNA polymerase sigma factor [Gammaproteobacteria bacterium]|nr:sigma-70 family RNA polymerase sigma factor [Gammaproteobacteria bacterium]